MKLKTIASHISSIERKYTWGIIGVVVSAAFGIIGIVYSYPSSKSISFQVIDEEQVFSLNDKTENLKELFKKQDLLSNKQDLIKKNLVVTRIRVKNTGSEEILSTEFDQRDPWGIKLKNGEIIAERIFNASSEYIKNKANPKIINGNTYEIEKVIFEKKQYLTFDLLMLINQNEKPKFQSIGKIAGIKHIQVLNKKKNSGEIKDDLFEFWNQVLYGNIWVHITRFLLYVILASFLISWVHSNLAEKEKD